MSIIVVDLNEIELKTVTSISPSSIVKIKECDYQLALLKSNVVPNGFNNNYHAIFGTFVHSLREKINKGHIQNELDFDVFFENELERIENIRRENSLGAFKSLRNLIPDFGLKVYQVLKSIKRFEPKFYTQVDVKSLKLGSEVKVISKNGLLSGQIDFVQFNENNELEIVEYKTSEVLDKDSEEVKVREDYLNQLLIYGFLYKESYGTLPKSLKIVDGYGKSYTADFTEGMLEESFQKAVELLSKFNFRVEHDALIFAKEKEICFKCSLKVLCSRYIDQNIYTEDNTVLVGQVINVEISGNSLSLTIKTKNSDILYIRGISKEYHERLLLFVGLKICLTHGYTKDNHNYKVTNNSKIYGYKQ